MTLVKNQIFTVSWGTRNKKWYESKGNIFTKKSDTFTVKVEDLTHGSNQRVKYICDNCTKTFENTYVQLLANRKNNNSNNDYCKKCAHTLSENVHRYSHDYVRDYFKSKGCVLLESNYTNSLLKLSYICICGNKANISFSEFKNAGSRCKKCVNSRRKTRLHSYEYVYDYFKNNGCELITKTYTGNSQKLEYLCVCEKKNVITFNSFSEGRRCKNCGIIKTSSARRNTYEKVASIFEEQKCKLISLEYQNVNTLLEFLCSCGNTDFVTLNNFNTGSRCKRCSSAPRTGENNPNWNPLITDEDRITKRNYPEYKKWVLDVLKKDNFTCQCCGQVGGSLVTHHLDGYHWCIDKRVDIDNGVVLCQECHTEFHVIYGNRENTVDQFIEFVDEFLSDCKIIDIKITG